jgi:predicted amidohydrolase
LASSEDGKQRPDFTGVRDILSLGGTLLRFCRAHASEVREGLADPQREAEVRVAWHAARLVFERHDRTRITPDALTSIVKELELAAGRLGWPLAARAFAGALDDAVGDQFAYTMRLRTTTLAPGDPVPTRRLRSRELVDKPMTYPWTVSEEIDRTPRLALAPADLAGLTVRLTWHRDDTFEAVKRGSRFAVILPNRSIDELEWTRYSDAEVPLFYGVRPRDPSRQERVVLRLLDLAVEGGAEVVVLPELSVSPGLVDRIRAWHGARRKRPAILVAGSHHVETPPRTAGANECVTLLSDGTELRHQKFKPYSFDDPSDDAGRPADPPIERREHLRPSPGEVTIHVAGPWSFVTPICKDLLELPLLRLLEDLRIRLVLVPACTPVTEIFEQRTGALAANAQSFVLVANLATSAEAVSILYGRPTREQTTIKLRHDRCPAVIYLDTLGNVSIQEVLDE